MMMYKKLLLLAASTSFFALAATADDQNIIQAAPSDESIVNLETVVVSSSFAPKVSASPLPATQLSGDELTLKMGNTIGDTLKQELGISSQSFGPGVGTPVIRGQSGPRVKVLENGIGSSDVSQLSPDHASSIDPSMAESIEVLRGPATLLYGSGIIGGVVNVIDNRIPTHLYTKSVNVVFDQRLDSATNESSSALKTEGSKGHWAYHLDGLVRERGDMSIAGSAIDIPKAQALDPTLTVVNNGHGTLANTFSEAFNGAAGASYINDKGFVGLGFNQSHNNYGIAPDGGTFSSNGIAYANPNVRIDQRQNKYDFKSELNQPFSFAEKVAMRFGYTDYYHTELNGGVPGIPYSPGTAFSNKTYEGRLELTHKDIGPFKGSVGFQATSSQFAAFNFPSGGVPSADLASLDSATTLTVPATQTNSFGVFGLESVNVGSMFYQAGLRVEDSTLTPTLSTGYIAPLASRVNSNYNYTPISASVSALWTLDKSNSFNMGLTRSQRAPQVQELFSNGFHDATRSYELGDPNLQMETSYNLDLGYKFKAHGVRGELDLFNNWANDYIYQQRTGNFVPPGFVVTANSQTLNNAQCLAASPTAACTPVAGSMQANAIFRGYETKLIFPVMENRHGIIDLTLFSDYTRGQFVNGAGNVPRLPPLRFGFQWDYSQLQWSGNVRFTRAQAQNDVGANDTATAGYYLLTMGGEYQIKRYHDTNIMIYLKGNNLLNENIRNSVSYLRNFSPEPGRGAQLGFKITY